LSFANGSIGGISYFANGDKSFPKERVEIFSSGCTAVLDDFHSAAVFGSGRKKEKKLMSQDKGQRQEVNAFVEEVRKGGQGLIPFDELYANSMTTFRIIDSIRSGQCLSV